MPTSILQPSQATPFATVAAACASAKDWFSCQIERFRADDGPTTTQKAAAPHDGGEHETTNRRNSSGDIARFALDDTSVPKQRRIQSVAGIDSRLTDMDDEQPRQGLHLDAAQLFRAHASYVANLLARLGAHAGELDDLVQEVFVVAHRRGGFIDNGDAKPTTWLAAIAIRVLSTHRRTVGRRREDDNAMLGHLPDAHAHPEEAAATAQSLGNVARALDGLDPKSRGVFVLFELEGESCVAIARALEIPVGTVYSRLHHARRQFRQAYDRLLEVPATGDQPTSVRAIP